MPTVRLDDQVYKALQDRAEPFVDTPNSVLRRILGLDQAGDSLTEPQIKAIEEAANLPKPRQHDAKKSDISKSRRGKEQRRRRALTGSLLPEDRYEQPLLQALVERGGAAPAREVIEAVGQKLQNQLTEVDQMQLQSGGVRWRNRVQFVRLRLAERGLIRKDTERGVWAITEEGRRAIEEERGI